MDRLRIGTAKHGGGSAIAAGDDSYSGHPRPRSLADSDPMREDLFEKVRAALSFVREVRF